MVRGGLVVDATGERRADVAVADGAVVAVEPEIEPSSDAMVLDAGGCVVAPGLVDLHTHLREPGREEAERVESGARAAALGGYTAVVAMPNTEPPIDSVAVVRQVLELGATAAADVAVAGAITVGREGERLAPLAEMAAFGVRLFTDDGVGVQDARLMRRALEYASALDVVLAQHCEEARLAAGGQMHEGEWSSRLGVPGIPAAAEELMVHRDISLARLTGARVHLLHLSTAASVAMVEAAKAEGLPVSAEAAPHHLCLTDAEVAGYDPVFKVNPPLRGPSDVAAVRAGLASGAIDAIGSLRRRAAGHDRLGDGAGGDPDRARRLAPDRSDPRPPVLAAGPDRGAVSRARRAGRDGRVGQPVHHRPRGHLGRRPRPTGQPEPQHAVRRTPPDGAGAPHRVPR